MARRGGTRHVRLLAPALALLLFSPATLPASQKPESPQADQGDEMVAASQALDMAGRLSGQNRPAEALPHAERALAVLERRLGRDNLATLLGSALVAALQAQVGRIAESDALFRRAIEGMERIDGLEGAQTISVLMMRAVTYSQQSRNVEALPVLARVARHRERTLGLAHPETIEVVKVQALALIEVERHSEAEQLLVRTVEALERPNSGGEATALEMINLLATAYIQQERWEDAEPLFRRVHDAYQRNRGPADPQTQLAAMGLAGTLYARRDYGEAAQVMEAAVAASERAHGLDDPLTLSVTSTLAMLRYAQGRYGDAEQVSARVRAAYERRLGADHPTTLRMMEVQGVALDALGRPEEAERALSRLVETRERVLGGDNLETLLGAAYLTEHRLARSDRAEAALEPARLLLRGALAGREVAGPAARGEIRLAPDRLRRNSWGSLFAEAAWAARQAGRSDGDALRAEAFAAVQVAIEGPADRAIVRMAARRAAQGRAAALGELAREREDLTERRDANDRDFAASFTEANESATADRAALRATRSRIDSRLAAIDERLGAEFPDYFALLRPQPVSLAETQRLLGEGEAILLVVPNRLGVQLFAVTRDRIGWSRSSMSAEQIGAAVERLRFDVDGNIPSDSTLATAWEAEYPAGTPYGFKRRIAYDLYRRLIEPLAPTLAGTSRLYVAASGPLATIPFSILVTVEPQGADNDPQALRDTAWLADRYALVNVPSIRSLALLRATPRRPADVPGGRPFAGFGNPVLEGSPAQPGAPRAVARADAGSLYLTRGGRSSGAMADVRRLRRLARLPGTLIELQEMAAALGAPPTAIFSADRATEPAVRTQDLTGVRVLAFATHGLLPREIDVIAEPGLVFTPPAVGSESDDGYLTTSEIAALRIDADWVILSACNTATGTTDEPGLSGLSRAFFYAGARSLLATHWRVADDVAPRITVRTIALERGGQSRATAFQQAIREIRLDRRYDGQRVSLAHPAYWAPFVLIGDGR